jgi:hypothetical protein
MRVPEIGLTRTPVKRTSEKGDEVPKVPPFELATNGDVWCTHDRRPVSTFRQTLEEPWYWEEVEAGFGHLVHDAEAEAFHTHSGHLALSRDVVDLRYLMPARP